MVLWQFIQEHHLQEMIHDIDEKETVSVTSVLSFWTSTVNINFFAKNMFNFDSR